MVFFENRTDEHLKGVDFSKLPSKTVKIDQDVFLKYRFPSRNKKTGIFNKTKATIKYLPENLNFVNVEWQQLFPLDTIQWFYGLDQSEDRTDYEANVICNMSLNKIEFDNDLRKNILRAHYKYYDRLNEENGLKSGVSASSGNKPSFQESKFFPNFEEVSLKDMSFLKWESDGTFPSSIIHFASAVNESCFLLIKFECNIQPEMMYKSAILRNMFSSDANQLMHFVKLDYQFLWDF